MIKKIFLILGLLFLSSSAFCLNILNSSVSISTTNGYTGIATSTPGYPLDVNGDIKITGLGNGLRFPDGSILTSATVGSSTASIITSTTNIKLVADSDITGDGEIQLEVGSTRVMTMLNNGYVGIGTTNPLRVLHVYHAGDNGITTERANNGIYSGHTFLTSGTEKFFLGQVPSSEDFYFSGNSKNFLVLQRATGYVGIGTTNPLSNFDVNGDVKVRGSYGVILSSGDTSKWNINLSSNDLNFSQTGVADNRLFLQESGNVGIGTNNPNSTLDVRGSITLQDYQSLINDSALYMSLDPEMIGFGCGNSYGVVIATATPNSSNGMRVGIGTVSPTEKLEVYNGNIKTNYGIISSTGYFSNNIGIGTNSPSAKLEVRGSIKIKDYESIYNDSNFYMSLDNDRIGFGNGAGYGVVINTTTAGSSTDMRMGIGTLNPSELLEVNGNIKSDYGVIATTITVSTITINGLNKNAYNASLADDGVIQIAVGNTSGGWGYVQAGDGEEFCRFNFTSNGTVTLEANSSNVDNADTDGKLCIYDAGSNPAIKNRLGSSKTVKYTINY